MKYLYLLSFLLFIVASFAQQPQPVRVPDVKSNNIEVRIDEPVAKQTADTSKIYNVNDVVDALPQYKNESDGWIQYLIHNIHYPRKAREARITGKVIVKFVVERNGTLSNFLIAKGVSPECDAEALRLVQDSGKWMKPATVGGKPVRCEMLQTIAFSL